MNNSPDIESTEDDSNNVNNKVKEDENIIKSVEKNSNRDSSTISCDSNISNTGTLSDGLTNCIGIERMFLSRIASTASACESNVSAIPISYDAVDSTEIGDVKFTIENNDDEKSNNEKEENSIVIPPSKETPLPSDNSQQQCDKNEGDTNGDTDNSEEKDYIRTDEWKRKEKHVFIFSQAGKPIYSRHGKEEDIVSLTGIMQALISTVQLHGGDSLTSINVGRHRIVFLALDHVYIVGAYQGVETERQVLEQLKHVHSQLLSVLTGSQLERMFRTRTNYDLRIMLAGSEKFFNSLLNRIDYDPGFLLNCVKNFPMNASTRDSISQIIANNAKVKDLVYAIYLYEDQLISKVCMKDYHLDVRDLGLIVNLVNGSDSFKSSESWSPICLPHFDATGYLHAHISYMEEECRTCLLLLTVNRDSFFQLSNSKHSIQQKLQQNSHLVSIAKRVQAKALYTPIPEDITPWTQHFIYKLTSLGQYTTSAPLDKHADWFSLYTICVDIVHTGGGVQPQQIYRRSDLHVCYVTTTATYELYVIFDPLTTQSKALQMSSKLLKHLKKNEDLAFDFSKHTF